MSQDNETPKIQKEETKKISREALEEAHKAIAVIGRELAPEFIDHMAEVAGEAVYDWMKANKVPQVVIDVLESVIILHMALTDLAENGEFSDIRAESVVENITSLTHDILSLGGDYSSGNSIVHDHEIVKMPTG